MYKQKATMLRTDKLNIIIYLLVQTNLQIEKPLDCSEVLAKEQKFQQQQWSWWRHATLLADVTPGTQMQISRH